MIASAKAALVSLLRALLGRRNLVRLGYALLDGGRLDVWNQMESNGERLVQQCVLAGIPKGDPVVVFDVGANLGLWSLGLIELARKNGRSTLSIFAFEPAKQTRAALEEKLAERGAAGVVEVVPKALSSEPGTQKLYLTGQLAGSNSLYARSDRPGEQEVEEIVLDRADAFSAAEGIARVNFMKIDAEGHDLAVLEGATGLLEGQRIDVLQFEYNWRWIDGRHFLRDAFELLGGYGYRLGKVTPKGIEFYPEWHPELESYREGNYLACRDSWVDRFPAIAWWNESGSYGR